MINSGIYKITCSGSSKFYIGSAQNLRSRMVNHLYNLRVGKHHSKFLQRSFNKYGRDSIKFEILARCPGEYLLKLEQWFINTLNPKFNSCKIAGSCRGIKWSKERNRKVSLALRGSGNGKARLSEEQVCQIREYIQIGAKRGLVLKEFNMTNAMFDRIKSNKTWQFLPYKGDSPKAVSDRSKVLNILQVAEIKTLLKKGGLTLKEIGILYNVGRQTIANIRDEKIWRHVQLETV